MSAMDVVAVVAATLPDPGNPSFVPFMGGFGLFVGGLVAHLRGLGADERARLMGVGTWFGIGLGGAVWIVLVAMDRL
jgi:hypothetical protein